MCPGEVARSRSRSHMATLVLRLRVCEQINPRRLLFPATFENLEPHSTTTVLPQYYHSTTTVLPQYYHSTATVRAWRSSSSRPALKCRPVPAGVLPTSGACCNTTWYAQ